MRRKKWACASSCVNPQGTDITETHIKIRFTAFFWLQVNMAWNSKWIFLEERQPANIYGALRFLQAEQSSAAESFLFVLRQSFLLASLSTNNPVLIQWHAENTPKGGLPLSLSPETRSIALPKTVWPRHLDTHFETGIKNLLSWKKCSSLIFRMPSCN